MSRLLLVCALLMASAAVVSGTTTPYCCPSDAITTTFLFNSPTGMLPTSRSYAPLDGSASVPVSGYTNSNVLSALYGTNGGTAQSGLGLNDGGSKHEVDGTHYVQFDLQPLKALMVAGTSFTFNLGDLKSNENYVITGSTTPGLKGSSLATGTGVSSGMSIVPVTITIPASSPIRYVSIAVTSSSSQNLYVDSLYYCRPICNGYVVGDPQFTGLRHQRFQVHGVTGEVYSIVSDKDFQYNSRFIFLDQGDCPILDGEKQQGCWSHPGTFLGELGLKTRAGDRIHVVPGSAENGFESIQFNNKTLEVGDEVWLEDDLGSLSYNSTHLINVKIGNWEFDFENSDMFVNQRINVINFKSIRSHGLLGQTWRDTTYASAIKYIQGAVDDYVIRSRSVFGDDFIYNNFN